jgi:hypothetical protein
MAFPALWGRFDFSKSSAVRKPNHPPKIFQTIQWRIIYEYSIFQKYMHAATPFFYFPRVDLQLEQANRGHFYIFSTFSN